MCSIIRKILDVYGFIIWTRSVGERNRSISLGICSLALSNEKFRNSFFHRPIRSSYSMKSQIFLFPLFIRLFYLRLSFASFTYIHTHFFIHTTTQTCLLGYVEVLNERQ